MKRCAVLLSMIVVASVAYGQELGRGGLEKGSKQEGLGRAALPAGTYEGAGINGDWGARASLGWGFMDWSVGKLEGSESMLIPQASVFFKVAESFDLNASVMYASGSGKNEESGATSASMIRLAVGAEYWVPTGARITPFVGAGVGYYIVDGDAAAATVTDVKSRPGAFVEGGAAFAVTDTLHLGASVTYDFLIGSAEATINGASDTLDVKVLSINIGVIAAF